MHRRTRHRVLALNAAKHVNGSELQRAAEVTRGGVGLDQRVHPEFTNDESISCVRVFV